MSAPRQYTIVRWRHGAGKTPSDFPICEQCYASVTDAAADMWAGQIEDVAQVVSIDLDAGTARDVTTECFAYCTRRSFDEQAEPFASLAKQMDQRGDDYWRERSDDYWTNVDAAFDRARDARLEAM